MFHRIFLRFRLGRLRSLSVLDPRRLIRAAFRLLAIDLRVRAQGFAKVKASLDRRFTAPREDGERSIEGWVRAVDVAARHHFYPMNCVPRALALRSFLAEEGVATELRIGVRREGEILAAHAWIELRGVPVGEAPTIDERFAILEPPPVA